MMLTRCPACQTVFRLRPEQLDARGGEVRCGHCFHPFNAREHAFEVPRELGQTPAAPTFAPPPASTPTHDIGATLDFDIPETDAPPNPATPAAPITPDDAEGERTTAAYSPWAAVAATPPAPPFPEVLRHTRRSSAAGAPPAADVPAVEKSWHEPLASIAIPAGDIDAQLKSPPETLARPSENELAPVGASATALAEGRDEMQPDAPDLARLDATYGRPPQRRHPVLGALGTLLALTLVLALAAQLGYLYRTDIARELPGLRPLLEQACARVGCAVPYPRDAEQIAIEASDLQAEPGKPGHYLLRATLNNRAQYAQQWPHLELTLTDAGDNPISRRVLMPSDWLPTDADATAFAGRRMLDLRIPFEAPGVAPTGYRIYAFYP